MAAELLSKVLPTSLTGTTAEQDKPENWLSWQDVEVPTPDEDAKMCAFSRLELETRD